jgi:hypothetical protein
MNAGQVVPFLKSVIASGERLSEQDVREIDAALAHATPERLDVERLARALPAVFAKFIPGKPDPNYDRAIDRRWAEAIAAAYLSQPDATEEAEWRESSKRLHRDGDDEPYTEEAGR